jgi:hypothetical protein
VRFFPRLVVIPPLSALAGGRFQKSAGEIGEWLSTVGLPSVNGAQYRLYWSSG